MRLQSSQHGECYAQYCTYVALLQACIPHTLVSNNALQIKFEF